MKRLRTILLIVLCACICHVAGARSVKVALILPFDVASGAPSVKYLDFYAGALLAVENQKNAGVNVRLTVIDLPDLNEDDSDFNDDLFENDVIIGPVRAGEMLLFQRICKLYETPFVSPLDPLAEDLAADNPYFFQVPTSPQRQAANLIARLKADGEGPVTLFCNPISPEEEELEARYDKALTEAGAASVSLLTACVVWDPMRIRKEPKRSR